MLKYHANERLCDKCERSYRTLAAWKLHRRTCVGSNVARPQPYTCLYCRTKFRNRAARLSHQAHCAARREQVREMMGGAGRRGAAPRRASPAGQSGKEGAGGAGEWDTTFALREDAALHCLPLMDERDLGMALIRYKNRLIEKLGSELLRVDGGIKWWLAAHVNVTREVPSADEGGKQSRSEEEQKVIRSFTKTMLSEEAAGLTEQVEAAILEVMNASEQLYVEGSQWAIDRVFALEIGTAHYVPLRAASYLPTPRWLAHPQKSIVNIRTSRECFRMSVLAQLYPARYHAERPRHYLPYLNRLNFGRIKSANMRVRDIPRFEKINPDISINVLAISKKGNLFPLHCPKERRLNHVTLLLLSRGKQRHYCLVRDMNALLYHLTKHKRRQLYCIFCMNRVGGGQEELTEHERYCSSLDPFTRVYPRPGSVISFSTKDYAKCHPPSHCCFLDFECLVKKLPEGAGGENGAGRRTRRTQAHVPVSYCILVTTWDGKLAMPMITHHAADGVAEQCINDLISLEERLFTTRAEYPIHLSEEQKRQAAAAVNCFLCGKPLGQDRVLDHNPWAPVHNLFSVSHSLCNSLRRKPKYLPVFCHGLSNYDGRLLFRGLVGHAASRGMPIFVLPRTHDNYKGIAIKVGPGGRCIKLLDSSLFYSCKLDDISKSLSEEAGDLNIMKEIWPDPTQRALLRQEGIFPHGYAQSYEELVNQTSLPPLDAFYSSLTERCPSQQEYERAQRIWEAFDCTNLLSFCLVYMQADVILLASFLSRARMSFLDTYGIELSQTWTMPGLTYLCALRYTGAEIELVSDPNMATLFANQKSRIYMREQEVGSSQRGRIPGLQPCQTHQASVRARRQLSLQFLSHAETSLRRFSLVQTGGARGGGLDASRRRGRPDVHASSRPLRACLAV